MLTRSVVLAAELADDEAADKGSGAPSHASFARRPRVYSWPGVLVRALYVHRSPVRYRSASADGLSLCASMGA